MHWGALAVLIGTASAPQAVPTAMGVDVRDRLLSFLSEGMDGLLSILITVIGLSCTLGAVIMGGLLIWVSFYGGDLNRLFVKQRLAASERRASERLMKERRERRREPWKFEDNGKGDRKNWDGQGWN